MGVKQILAYSALSLAVLAGFTSCKKEFTCYCYNDYRDVFDTTISRYHNDSRHTIEAVKKEYAENECKYYQTHEMYLEYEVYVEHHCNITDEE